MTPSAHLPSGFDSIFQDRKDIILTVRDDKNISAAPQKKLDKFTNLFLHINRAGRKLIFDLYPYLDNKSVGSILSLNKEMHNDNETWGCCLQRIFPDHFRLQCKQNNLSKKSSNFRHLFKSRIAVFDEIRNAPPTTVTLRKLPHYAVTTCKTLVAYAVTAVPDSRIEICREVNRCTIIATEDARTPVRQIKMVPQHNAQQIKNVYLIHDEDGKLKVMYIDPVGGQLFATPSKFVDHLFLGKPQTNIVGLSISSKKMNAWTVSDNGVVCLWNVRTRIRLGQGKIDGTPLCMAREKFVEGLPTKFAVATSTNDIWLGSFVHAKVGSPLVLQHIIDLRGHYQRVSALVMRNDRLYSGDVGGNLLIWAMRDSGEMPELIHRLSVFPTGAITAIKKAPDQLLIASNNGEGSIFKLESNDLLKKLRTVILGKGDSVMLPFGNSYIASSVEGVRRITFSAVENRADLVAEPLLTPLPPPVWSKRFVYKIILITVVLGILSVVLPLTLINRK